MSLSINVLTGELVFLLGPSGGGGGGGLTSAKRTTNTVSAPFTVPTLATVDYLLNVDTTAAPVAITLPDAIASDGLMVFVKRYRGGNNVTFVTQLGQKVDDSLTPPVIDALNNTLIFAAIGGNWSLN